MDDKRLLLSQLKTYDRDYFDGSRELSPLRFQKTVTILGIVEGKRILDLGASVDFDV